MSKRNPYTTKRNTTSNTATLKASLRKKMQVDKENKENYPTMTIVGNKVVSNRENTDRTPSDESLEFGGKKHRKSKRKTRKMRKTRKTKRSKKSKRKTKRRKH